MKRKNRGDSFTSVSIGEQVFSNIFKVSQSFVRSFQSHKRLLPDRLLQPYLDELVIKSDGDRIYEVLLLSHLVVMMRLS